MSLTAAEAEALATRLATDAGKLHDIVHGDAATIVDTEGGPVPSIARRLADPTIKGDKGDKGDPGTSFTVDATGPLADRALHDAAPEGFSFLATDNGSLYIRETAAAGVWSAAIPFGKGDQGDDGLSAYEVALAGGFVGTEAEWLASLVGPRGPAGTGTGDVLGPAAHGDNTVALWDGANTKTLKDSGVSLSSKQNSHANLTSLAALALAADRLLYATGAGTLGLAPLTTFARTLLDDADAATMRTTLGAASPADISAAINALVGSAPGALDTINELAAALGNDPNFATTMTNALAGKQAAHANLTALAGLALAADRLLYATGAGTLGLATLTAFARTLLDDADAATMRQTLGLTIGTNVQAYDAELAALAALTSAANKLPYFTGAGAAALTDLTSFARTLLDDADAATMRATLGLTIGTNVQAYDAELAALASLASAANTLPYFTGAGAAALTDLTAFARTLLDDADAATMLTTLGALGTAALATASNLAAGTAGKVLTADNVPDASAPVALADAATIAINWATFINGTVTLGGNRTLGAPTNGQPGTWRTILVSQDATGSRTLSFNAAYKFPGGTAAAIAPAANSVTRLQIFCRTTSIYEVYAAAGIA